MHDAKRKLTGAALAAGVAVTLAACGAGSSSHVVGGTTVPVTATSTPAPTSTTVSPGTTIPVTAVPTTTVTSDTLSANTLNQVATELGSLDGNLSTADNDLNNPQGDS